MPKFRSFHARIKVGGEYLPEYDVQIDKNKKQVSCWIPSEAGKKFVVWCSNTAPLVVHVAGHVSLDGFLAGINEFRGGSKSEWIRSYCRTSPTTVRDFSFASVTFTDDDAYLNSPVANLGEIKIEIWTIEDVGSKGSGLIDPTRASNAKVHERSKKIGTHRVQFNDLREVPYARTVCHRRVDRLATFVFRYRPLALLRANGIAPPAPPLTLPRQNNKRKRKISDSDAKETEPEIDKHVEELKADIAVFSQNLNALQDKLKQLESRRAKKIKVKIEKREHSALFNEVIDLT